MTFIFILKTIDFRIKTVSTLDESKDGMTT